MMQLQKNRKEKSVEESTCFGKVRVELRWVFGDSIYIRKGREGKKSNSSEVLPL